MNKLDVYSLQKKADRALKRAIRLLIQDHKRTGQPVVVWQGGKVVKVPADRLLRKTG